MYKFFFLLQLNVAYALLPHWPKAEALFLARYVLPTRHANTSKPTTPNTPFVTKSLQSLRVLIVLKRSDCMFSDLEGHMCTFA